MKLIATEQERRPDVPPPLLDADDDRVGFDLLHRLADLGREQGLDGLAVRFLGLADLVTGDLAAFERSLSRLTEEPPRTARDTACLLGRGDTPLRALTLALVARTGAGFSPQMRDLAIAVEMVDSAHLLHEDILESEDQAPAASGGNGSHGGNGHGGNGHGGNGAAPPETALTWVNPLHIFAGDWLLVEALRRVQRCRFPLLMERLFDTIEEMIFAESTQIEYRGQPLPDRETYLRFAAGKKGSIFGWAALAGAVAGELPDHTLAGFERYGHHLGLVVQLRDDASRDDAGRELAGVYAVRACEALAPLPPSRARRDLETFAAALAAAPTEEDER